MPKQLRSHYSFSFAILVFFASLISVAQQLPASANPRATAPGLYDPTTDPRAIVTIGQARFTVLTPQLIRMEWAADGQFEDHASLVFLNRHLPVPKFTTSVGDGGSKHTIRTEALSLEYTVAQNGNGRFGAKNLQLSLQLNGQEVFWHPGLEDKGNLQGTTRT